MHPALQCVNVCVDAEMRMKKEAQDLGSSSLNLCFPVSSLLRWQRIFQHQVTLCPLSVSVGHSWEAFLFFFKKKLPVRCGAVPWGCGRGR